MAIKVRPYRQGSRSARTLANALRGRVLRLEGSTWRPRRGDTVINWGNVNNVEYPDGVRVLNPPGIIRSASNKREAFLAFERAGISIPRFTVNAVEARDWNTNVVGRHELAGHSGRGIEIFERGNDIPAGIPLYVEYIRKRDEYRVHVVNGRVVDTQQKRRRRELPDEQVNYQVRSHANGFVFAREDVVADERRDTLAIDAVSAVDLDFGAVDIIYNAHYDRYYVLEINTAPGLEGQTVVNYAEAFRQA